MKTQEQIVLSWLKTHKRAGLSQAEAAKMNIYDLAGRVCRLEDKGAKIERVRVSVKDDDGKERTHYTRYFLRRNDG